MKVRLIVGNEKKKKKNVDKAPKKKSFLPFFLFPSKDSLKIEKKNRQKNISSSEMNE